MVKENRIKVLHILNGFGFGGAETWLLEIVKFNRGRMQIDFLLTSGEHQVMDSEFVKLGCNLYYLKFSAGSVLKFVSGLNRIVKQGNYTIIHDHEDFAAGWHWLFLLFNLPRKRICHAHNSMIYVKNYSNSARRRMFYSLGKSLNGWLATHLTGTSNMLMDELGYDRAFYKRKRIEPIYCGAEPGLFKYEQSTHINGRKKFGFSEDDVVVIFIGRIGLQREGETNHKNPEFAFSIAREMSMKNAKYKFIFIGEKGSLGQDFELEVKRLGLGAQIFFLGKRHDVNELLATADLMLFTSTLEPFGLVLVEAQFSSLPIVASNIITKELIFLPGLFTLLDIQNERIVEWTKAVEVAADKKSCRLAISEANEKVIDDSIFSIKSSYERMQLYYEN